MEIMCGTLVTVQIQSSNFLEVVKPDIDCLINDQSTCLASISSLSLMATDNFFRNLTLSVYREY